MAGGTSIGHHRIINGGRPRKAPGDAFGADRPTFCYFM